MNVTAIKKRAQNHLALKDTYSMPELAIEDLAKDCIKLVNAYNKKHDPRPPCEGALQALWDEIIGRDKQWELPNEAYRVILSSFVRMQSEIEHLCSQVSMLDRMAICYRDHDTGRSAGY